MDSIQKLIEIFRRFPTVGSRTARRFVYYLIKLPKEEVNGLIDAINDLRKKVKLCNLCFNPYEGDEKLCPICRDQSRNKNLLCIVEKEADLLSIESTNKYNGLYFILGGTVSLMRKDDLKQLRLEHLKSRLKNEKFSEIIIALNPTPEGKITSILLEKEIGVFGAKITHLARGIPVGGELEYADEETLESALEGRK